MNDDVSFQRLNFINEILEEKRIEQMEDHLGHLAKELSKSRRASIGVLHVVKISNNGSLYFRGPTRDEEVLRSKLVDGRCRV